MGPPQRQIPNGLPTLGRFMSTLPASILEGREAIGPWNYSARVPEGASSRDYAFLPLVAGILFHGTGIFLAQDVARHVPFWNNAVVWLGIVQAALCFLLSAWMFWARWVWTAPQMALLGICGLGAVFWTFQLASLLSFLFYSGAPLGGKLLIALAFLGWQGWWNQRVAKRCLSIWDDKTRRDRVWLRYDCATVYRRSSAKAEMDAVGVQWHTGVTALVVPFLACVPLYYFRNAVVGYLDAPLVPVLGVVMGLTLFVLASTAVTVSIVMMLVIPARIVAETGNPVLMDMMTPANAPK